MRVSHESRPLMSLKGYLASLFLPKSPHYHMAVLLISHLMLCIFFSKQKTHIGVQLTQENYQLVTGCKLPAVKRVIQSQMIPQKNTMALSLRKMVKLNCAGCLLNLDPLLYYYTNCSTRNFLPQMSSIQKRKVGHL